MPNQPPRGTRDAAEASLRWGSRLLPVGVLLVVVTGPPLGAVLAPVAGVLVAAGVGLCGVGLVLVWTGVRGLLASGTPADWWRVMRWAVALVAGPVLAFVALLRLFGG